MTRRFQLVFRSDGSERTETRDTTGDGDPHIDGQLIIDGQVYVIRGIDWLLTADDLGDTKRFLCTIVAEPADPNTPSRASRNCTHTDQQLKHRHDRERSEQRMRLNHARTNRQHIDQ